MLSKNTLLLFMWSALVMSANFQACSYNEYYDGTNCNACDTACSSCSGPGSTNCSSCPPPLVLLNSTCISSCPSGYQINTRQNTCQSCFRNCSICASGYYSFQGFCIGACPAVTTSDGSGSCQQTTRISAPIILVSETDLGYINLDADLFIDVEVISKSAFSAMWTSNRRALLKGVAINQPKLLIPKSNLETSLIYQLSLTVTNEIGSVEQLFTFKTYSAPIRGQIVINLNPIIAVDTEFTLNISGYSGDQGFLVDIIALQVDITAQEYNNLRYVVANIYENSRVMTSFNPVILAKGLQNDPTGFLTSLIFPPIEVSARYKILAVFYNLYQRFIDEITVLVNVQDTKSISSFSQLSSATDVYYAAKLMRIYLNFTLVGQCYQSANTLQYANLYGNQDCPSEHCNNNGNCSLSGSRPNCNCNNLFTGLCCQTSSNNSAFSSLSLLSGVTAKISELTINFQTYGPIAQTIVELSCLVNYMDAITIISLISSFSNLLSQDYYFTLPLAGELYTAWAQIRALSQDILSQSLWSSQDFESIKSALDSSVTRSLSQDMIFSSQAFFVSSYSSVINANSFLLMSSAPQIPGDQNNVATPTTGVSLETNAMSNFQVDVSNTSFLIPKTIDVAPNEIIRISTLQGNFFFEPGSTSTFSVSFNLARNNQNILFTGVLSQVEVIIPKMIPLPYPNYKNLYSCVGFQNENNDTKDCILLGENSSHILCSCRASADLSLISGTSLSSTQSNLIPFACCIAGTQEAMSNQYYPLFDALYNYTADLCSISQGFFDNWTAVGLVILIVLVVFYLFGCLILYFIDIYERKRRLQTPRNGNEATETQSCRYNQNLTLSPLYSILFCAKVQGTSRIFRWTLYNYFWWNLLGWSLAYNDGLSYANSISFFVKSIFGLITSWIWYYASIGLINYLQTNKADRANMQFTVRTHTLKGMIVINVVGWGLYFIFRTSVLDVQSVYDQIASVVVLALIDAIAFDLIIILIGGRKRWALFYFSLRGFYKLSLSGSYFIFLFLSSVIFLFIEPEGPQIDAEGTERLALKSLKDVELTGARPLPSKIFFSASDKETFEGPLGPLGGIVISKAD